MTIRKAVVYNLLSSVLSLLGVLAGLWLGEFENASYWIYAATGGTFLYISLATLVPEMQKQCKTILDVVLVLGGMFCGGAIMFVIACYEHTLEEFLNEEYV
ncbi:zinc transporter foi-like [Cimex lectularius]|nr:zinc transporter foi-like [Cimex lectularius]